MALRNSVVNRDLGVCPFEAYFCCKPTFSCDQLSIKDVAQVNPNDFANLCAAMDVCLRTAAAVASSQVTAQDDRERSPPPTHRPGDYVLVYFPDRESKCLTYYRGPFQILAADDAAGNYYSVIDCIQKNECDISSVSSASSCSTCPAHPSKNRPPANYLRETLALWSPATDTA